MCPSPNPRDGPNVWKSGETIFSSALSGFEPPFRWRHSPIVYLSNPRISQCACVLVCVCPVTNNSRTCFCFPLARVTIFIGLIEFGYADAAFWPFCCFVFVPLACRFLFGFPTHKTLNSHPSNQADLAHNIGMFICCSNSLLLLTHFLTHLGI